MLLLHLVSRAEETMTLFVSSFKHFHGPLPAGPHQWPAQAETGKVRGIFPRARVDLSLGRMELLPLNGLGVWPKLSWPGKCIERSTF